MTKEQIYVKKISSSSADAHRWGRKKIFFADIPTKWDSKISLALIKSDNLRNSSDIEPFGWQELCCG